MIKRRSHFCSIDPKQPAYFSAYLLYDASSYAFSGRHNKESASVPSTAPQLASRQTPQPVPHAPSHTSKSIRSSPSRRVAYPQLITYTQSHTKSELPRLTFPQRHLLQNDWVPDLIVILRMNLEISYLRMRAYRSHKLRCFLAPTTRYEMFHCCGNHTFTSLFLNTSCASHWHPEAGHGSALRQMFSTISATIRISFPLPTPESLFLNRQRIIGNPSYISVLYHSLAVCSIEMPDSHVDISHVVGNSLNHLYVFFLDNVCGLRC